MFCARSQRPFVQLSPPASLYRPQGPPKKRRQPLAECVNLWYVGLNGNAVSRERSLRGPSLRGV